MRAVLLSADVAGRTATARRLEEGGLAVVGEGRTAQDGRRLERGADVIVVDSDELARELAGTVRRPVLLLTRTTGAPPPDAAPPGGAVLALPWPASRRAVGDAIAHLAALGGRPAPEAAGRPRARTAPTAPVDRREHPAGEVRPRIIVLAASAGGPPALAEVLGGLGPTSVPIVIAQHLHADFSDALRAWLERAAGREVRDVRDGEVLRAGDIVLATPRADLAIDADGRCALVPAIGVHHPSIDVLLGAVARAYGPAAAAVVLTGMGTDGAAGLRAMRDAGALTIAQDQATSAVFGMPAAAVRAGAAGLVLPLPEIAGALRARLQPTRGTGP